MMDHIKSRFEYFYDLPFPALGGTIGDFLLYDSLLAGVVSSYISGARLGLDDIPTPDDETMEAVLELRRKSWLTQEEQSFLEYFDVLEALRVSLEQALQPGQPGP